MAARLPDRHRFLRCRLKIADPPRPPLARSRRGGSFSWRTAGRTDPGTWVLADGCHGRRAPGGTGLLRPWTCGRPSRAACRSAPPTTRSSGRPRLCRPPGCERGARHPGIRCAAANRNARSLRYSLITIASADQLGGHRRPATHDGRGGWSPGAARPTHIEPGRGGSHPSGLGPFHRERSGAFQPTAAPTRTGPRTTAPASPAYRESRVRRRRSAPVYRTSGDKHHPPGGPIGPRRCPPDPGIGWSELASTRYRDPGGARSRQPRPCAHPESRDPGDIRYRTPGDVAGSGQLAYRTLKDRAPGTGGQNPGIPGTNARETGDGVLGTGGRASGDRRGAFPGTGGHHSREPRGAKPGSGGQTSP